LSFDAWFAASKPADEAPSADEVSQALELVGIFSHCAIHITIIVKE